MEIKTDKIYKLKGESDLLKLKTIEKNGIHIFNTVDARGKTIKAKNPIFEESILIVTERIGSLAEVNNFDEQIKLF